MANPAAEIDLANDRLVVQLRGAARLLWLRRLVAVPVAAITGVRVDERISGDLSPRLAAMGFTAWLPGVVFAGDLRHLGGRGRELWAVRPGAPALVIELRDTRFARFILTVADPRSTAARIDRARPVP